MTVFNKSINGTVSDRYLYDTPLVSILNVSTYEEKEMPFQLDKETDVQVYGVGEAGVYYMNRNPDYMFMSDDIEFYFDFPNTESDVIMNQEGHFAFSFSWLDGTVKSNRLSFFKQGCEYAGYYDTLSKSYVAEIKFPWKIFNISEMRTDTTVGFDIAVGDNDDGLMQTGKIIWHSQSDNLMATSQAFGKLTLTNIIREGASVDTVFSSFAHPVIDGLIDSVWNHTGSYPISNEVMGMSNPDDLSAFFKSYWDKKNLYFLVIVHDQSKKVAKSKGIRNQRTLSDFGYIEDDKGNKVWEMHIRDALHAGGAQKNVKVDQVVHLGAGKYRLKYFSDESHAWNNWDDTPPNTSFYGIIIYKCR